MEKSQHNKVIVLGAGITGLVTAWKLALAGRDVTIIEGADAVGGLARTYEWDGYYFDNGAHNFFTRDEGILEFYNTHLPGMLIYRQRNFKLFLSGRLLNFPFLGPGILVTFGLRQLLMMGGSFAWARIKLLFSEPAETPYLDEWVIKRYGGTLYRLYFRPYLMSVQKTDPKELSSAIGRKKIPLMSIRKMLREMFVKIFFRVPVHQQTGVSYYCKKGIGRLPSFFYERLREMPNVRFCFNERLLSLQDGNGRIEGLRTTQTFYDTTGTDIISTIPLAGLCVFEGGARQETQKVASKLVYNQMRFFFVKVKKESVSGCWFVNFNDARIPFYRVSEEVFGQWEMVPEQGCCSLIFELSVTGHDEYAAMSDEELLDRVLERFNVVFPLVKEDVLAYRSLFCPTANPKMVVHYQKHLTEVFNFILSRSNLFSLGRQGFFTYANVDQCTRMALDFSEFYLTGKGTEGNKLLFDKYLARGFH